jgi:2'-5' RNA ligase
MGIRAFIAIDLPAECREALAGVQEQLAPVGRGVKWARPEGIHLTLKFLGDIDEAQVEAVSEAMRAAASGSDRMSLQMKGVGAFPGVARPRVVWVGVVGDVAPLAALQRDLEARLALLGFEPEARRFSPHLTLGRVKEFTKDFGGRGKSRLGEAIVALAGLELSDFEAAELVLFRSELKPGGAVYTRLRAVALGSSL